MDFTISEELNSVQQLAAQILGDFTEVDKLKAVEQQEERFDPALWQALQWDLLRKVIVMLFFLIF